MAINGTPVQKGSETKAARQHDPDFRYRTLRSSRMAGSLCTGLGRSRHAAQIWIWDNGETPSDIGRQVARCDLRQILNRDRPKI